MSYIDDTKYTVELLFNGLNKDNEVLNDLCELHYLCWDFSTYDLSEDFDDCKLQYKYVKLHECIERQNIKGVNYIDLSEEERKAYIEKLRIEIANRQVALDALAMSILQIAKQGISIHFGCYEQSKNKGRKLFDDIFVSDVVWHGRNQSIHYEESGRKSTKDFFDRLHDMFPNENMRLGTDNKAKSIIKLLGWIDYDKYEKDMKIILPE